MSIKAEAECNSCGVMVPVEQSANWMVINPLSAMGVPIGNPMHLCREKCVPEFAAKYPGAELAAFLVETAPRVEEVVRRVRLEISSDGPVSPRLERTTIVIRQKFEWFKPREIIIPGGTADAPLESMKHPVTGMPHVVRVGAESAKDWVVSDFRVGNRSQFAQAGEISGDVIREMGEMDYDRCQADMTMSIDVRYIGKNPEGEVFTATMLGFIPEDAVVDGSRVDSKTAPNDYSRTAGMVMVKMGAETIARRATPTLDVQQPFKALPVPVQAIAKNLETWFAKFGNEPNRITQRSPSQMLMIDGELEVANVAPDDVITMIIDSAKNIGAVHASGAGRIYNIVSLVLAHTRKLAPSDQQPRYVIRVIDRAEPFLPNKKRDEAKLVFEMPAELRGVPAGHAADTLAGPTNAAT